MSKKKSTIRNVETKKTESLKEFAVETSGKPMTTDQGIYVEHTIDSLKAGPRGPTLIEDFHLREKIMRFDHERIPERVVHARGAGAHGVFQVYKPVKYSKAKFLQDPSIKTPVFVRFSTVAGSRGSADTVRDVRGFATKFYSEEGNFDLVGNNIPVFFIQDGIKFPDLIHSVKPEPHNEIPQAASAHNSFWDFISLTPESTHMIMWHLSDRAIPRSYAHMQGFGVHTFRLVDSKGKSVFVKFHWKPLSGAYSLVWDEAQKLAGKDADFHRRGLFEAIERGDYPEYELGIQVVEEKDEHKFDFDLLDPTKIIPEDLVPVQPIGKMTLNRNPDNYFAETEQVAFCVANVVPGIDVTNDPLMQARLFSYLDTQLTRLGGPNFAEIPINRPINPVSNHQQDGHMRTGIMKSKVNYFPNSLDGNSPHMTPEKKGGYVHYPEHVDGKKIRARGEKFDDHFSQATLFYNSLSKVEQDHLISAAQFELSNVEFEHIRQKIVDNFALVDADFAKKVADQIGIKPSGKKVDKPKKQAAKNLSLLDFASPDLRGRQVGIVVEDGFSMKELTSLKAALQKEKAFPVIVGLELGDKKADTGSVTVMKRLKNAPSLTFDAIYLLQAKKSKLDSNQDVKEFVQEAYSHLKPVGFSHKTDKVLEAFAIKNDEFIVDTTKDFIEALKNHRYWPREKALYGVV